MAANRACAAPRANSSLLGGEVAELSTPTLELLRKQEPGPPHSASTRSSTRPKASAEAYSATARSRGIVEAHLRMPNAAFFRALSVCGALTGSLATTDPPPRPSDTVPDS